MSASWRVLVFILVCNTAAFSALAFVGLSGAEGVDRFYMGVGAWMFLVVSVCLAVVLVIEVMRGGKS